MDPSYKRLKDSRRVRIDQKYRIAGFISSGTYGKVYKAVHIESGKEVAIKKFKPEKDFDPSTSAFSQSACREIALCRELKHENIIGLNEVLIDPLDRSIYMAFDYAEHDLLQILHHHGHTERKPVPELFVKSLLYQLINGVAYLHANWVLHRDLKPANILVMRDGTVKIADLGLARLFQKPLLPLFSGDKVVVTIWYRAPELLLGSRHYTKAVDMWAVGCIFAELLTLRPLFKGEESKMDGKKHVPFQRHQLTKIFEVLGSPTKERWPSLDQLPEYHNLATFSNYTMNNLRKTIASSAPHWKTESGFSLLLGLLDYDPNTRLTAEKALDHPYFKQEPQPLMNPFAAAPHPTIEYPLRKIAPLDDSETLMASGQATTGANLLNLKLENMPSTGTGPASVSVGNLFGSLTGPSSLPSSAAVALGIQQHAAKLSYEKIGADAAAMAAAAAARVERDAGSSLLSNTMASAMERTQLAEMMAQRGAASGGGSSLFGSMPGSASPLLGANQAALMNFKQQLSQQIRGIPNPPSQGSLSTHLQQAVNVQMQFKNAAAQQSAMPGSSMAQMNNLTPGMGPGYLRAAQLQGQGQRSSSSAGSGQQHVPPPRKTSGTKRQRE